MMTLVPERISLAYFPRIPLLKSYSGRMVSRLELLRDFLILSSFATGCTSRANEADGIASFRLGDNDQPVVGAGAQEQVTVFAGGMIGVWDGRGHWIGECSDGLRKTHAVLA